MLTGNRTHHATCPCGWEGRYTTPGYAAKAKRAHSCQVDYTPRECTAPHGHGAAHYKHCGCRCWPCRLGMLEQVAASGKARAYGRGRLVDATPAREHVRSLMDAGMGWPRLAELSGVDGSVIIRLVWGKTAHGKRWVSQRIARTTEAKLLAVTYDPADGSRAIDADTTRRRLRSLVALGWWPSALAREIGWEQAYLDRLLYGKGDQVRVRPGTARRVHAEYRRLVDALAPSGPYADRARRQAAERGWTPPLRLAGRVVVGTALDMREAS